MTRLSVNLNKIALLRNTRDSGIPDVLEFGRMALDAGAGGLTVHPRPDQRHIRPADVDALAELFEQASYRDREFNLEGNPRAPSFLEHVRRVRPHQCTLVPDAVDQRTSDHGYDVAGEEPFLREVCSELRQLACRVSLFVDPDLETIAHVPATGAERIELYTEVYARAFREQRELSSVYRRFQQAARRAEELGLGVNAGHDLDLQNLGGFVAMGGILEVSIGHALTADALRLGMTGAVDAYLRVLREAGAVAQKPTA